MEIGPVDQQSIENQMASIMSPVFGNMANLCLLCANAQNPEEQPFLDIYGQLCTQLKILDKIYKCLTITIEAGFPLQVCVSCVDKLNVCHELAQSSEMAYVKFKTLQEEWEANLLQTDVKAEPLDNVNNSWSPMYVGVPSPEVDFFVESQELETDLQPTNENGNQCSEEAVEENQWEEYSMLQQSALVARGSQIAIFVTEESTESEHQHRLSLLLINIDEGCANNKEKIIEKVSRVMQLVRKRIATKKAHPGRIEYMLYSPNIVNKLLHSCHSCRCSFFLQEEMLSHFESLHPEEVHQCSVCDKKICGPAQMQENHMELHRSLEEGQTDELLSNLGVHSLHSNIFDPEFVVVPLGKCPSKFPMGPIVAEKLHSKLVNVIKRNLWIKPDMKDRISHSLKTFISKIQLCKRVKKPKPKVEHNEGEKEILRNYLESYLAISNNKDIFKSKSQQIREEIECCHCSVSYKAGDENSHIELYHNGGKNLVCKICDKFNKSGENQPHMIPKSDFPFPCPVKRCRKVYQTEANLEEHMDTAHISESSPCLCELCGKVYSDKCGLRQHLRNIHFPKKDPKYSCDLCDVRYVRKENLKRHKISVHEPKVTCKVCGKLVTRIVIHRHMKLHDDSSKFPCKYCGKLYISRGSCNVHEQSRHEGVQIRCTICKDLTFKSIKGMEEHRLKHERGEEIILPPYLQPVQCSICSKNLPNSIRLKEHMKIHKKPTSKKRKMTYVNGFSPRETTFPCVPCLLRFLTQECYDKHVKTHHPDGVPVTTSKPKALEFRYQCRYCEKIFKKKSLCDDHESSVHGSGKRHACEFCGQRFNYYADKWTHKQKCKVKCAVGSS